MGVVLAYPHFFHVTSKKCIQTRALYTGRGAPSTSWFTKAIDFLPTAPADPRGFLPTAPADPRVSSLKSQEKIRKAVVRRAFEVHSLMLKCYYQAKFGPPDRDWVNLALVKARATSLPSSRQSVFVHFLAPP